ncbi:2310_t:CDS:2 [Paraglomus occultum]|uniref:2310_t:CDS:1 n=1 Tax=Paraglomus occultum TaxID=144539 RepID=A0A9N9ALG3_9GLOM|nr:2310_t:CDS:2 [Paraglomus occultum]
MPEQCGSNPALSVTLASIVVPFFQIVGMTIRFYILLQVNGDIYAVWQWACEDLPTKDSDVAKHCPSIQKVHDSQVYPQAIGQKKDKHKLSYPINIFAFSDNQFGLRVFNELVESAAARHKQPHYILHAGDAVQEDKNLQQWRTDFYDPLTASYLGQQAP